MVIDPDAPGRQSLTTFLRYHGYEVREAGEAAQALALTVAQRTELVIADIRLPFRDGVKLFSEVRRQCPDTAVILVAALQDRDALLRKVMRIELESATRRVAERNREQLTSARKPDPVGILAGNHA